MSYDDYLIVTSMFFLNLVVLYAMAYTPHLAKFSDKPDGVLKTHSKPIPNVAGYILILTFFLAFALTGEMDQWYLPVAVLGLFSVSAYDDRRPLSWKTRLLIHFGVAGFFVFGEFGQSDLSPLHYLLATIYVVAAINAFNVVDNADGVAALSALFASAALLILAPHADVSTTVLYAILPFSFMFVIFNLPPAKVYLGDGGSTALGLLLGSAAAGTVAGDLSHDQVETLFKAAAVLTLVLFFPLFDLVYIVIARLMKGRSPFKGSNDHLMKRLMAIGFTVHQALIIMIGLNLLALLAVISIEFGQPLGAIPVALGSVFLMVKVASADV